MKKLASFIEDFLGQKNTLFLSVTLILFALFRFPSINEPYWYGDEGVYEVIGNAIANGRILYSQIWDNKPPLLYLIYALFAGDQFWVRVLSLIVGLLSVVVFFAFARKLFKNRLALYVSTAFFVYMFGTPIIEGNVANAENFMILPILAAFYLCFAVSKKNVFTYFFAGIIFSLAFLIKIVAVFDFISALLIIFTLSYSNIKLSSKTSKKELFEIVFKLKDIKFLIIGFLIPIVIASIYFWLNSALPDFLSAAFSQNVGYVAYGNFFIIKNGLLYLKMALLLISILLVFKFKKNLGSTGVIVLIWFFCEFFSSLFSARPYTHYLLVLLPSFSVLLGLIIENKKIRIITILIAVVSLLILNANFKVHKETIRYYSNYIKYITGGSVDAYRASFDENMIRDYDLANFINSKTNKNENVFLWGDSPQIYALSNKLPPGRYTVAYHITSYPGAIEETKEAIDKVAPKYIIQTKEDPAISNFLAGYKLRYIIDKAKIYEKQP